MYNDQSSIMNWKLEKGWFGDGSPLNVGLVFPGSMLKIFSKPVGWDGGHRRRKFKEETVTGVSLSETGDLCGSYLRNLAILLHSWVQRKPFQL